MHALVVYESMYGNTRQVATAIAEGLAAKGQVDLVEVSKAPTAVPEDVTLLVVGGPTHAFGMSRERTRHDAGERSEQPVESTGIGVREWLEQVSVPKGMAAAAFDTRISHPRLPGAASKGVAKGLRKAGCQLVASATDFYVDGATGPLEAGELERAKDWAGSLVGRCCSIGAARRAGGRAPTPGVPACPRPATA